MPGAEEGFKILWGNQEFFNLQCNEHFSNFTCVTGLILATLSEEKVKALAGFPSHLVEGTSWVRLSASKVNGEPWYIALERGSSPARAAMENINFLK